MAPFKSFMRPLTGETADGLIARLSRGQGQRLLGGRPRIGRRPRAEHGTHDAGTIPALGQAFRPGKRAGHIFLGPAPGDVLVGVLALLPVLDLSRARGGRGRVLRRPRSNRL